MGMSILVMATARTHSYYVYKYLTFGQLDMRQSMNGNNNNNKKRARINISGYLQKYYLCSKWTNYTRSLFVGFFLFPLFLRLSTLWIMGWQYTLDYGSLASVCYICMNMLDGLANTAAHVKNRTDRRLCMCVTSITEQN